MKQTIAVLSAGAMGLWVLVVLLTFGVSALFPTLRGTVATSTALLALGGLIAAVAWLLSVISAARGRRWGWLEILAVPGLAFTALVLLAIGVLPDFQGDDPLVAGLFTLTLLTPALTWMYGHPRPTPLRMPAPLAALDDLVRTARWEGMPAGERGRLLDPFGALAAPATHETPFVIDHASDTATQDWVARVIAPQLQKEAASVIRTWLQDASPNAHLLAIGRGGHGKTSLVSSLARQAMATRPARPDLCAVPDPGALERPVVLRFPPGAAEPFARALREALDQICETWDEEALRDPRDRAALVARALDPVHRATPPDGEARAYLDRLQVALADLAAASGAPEFCAVEVRQVGVGRDRRAGTAGSAGGAGEAGAPVVVFSRLRQGGMLDALKAANGGILVVPSGEILDERGQPSGDAYLLQLVLGAGSLPEDPREVDSPSVPIAVRVALVVAGDPAALASAPDDFFRAFRYEAWFNAFTDWTPEAEAAYAALIEGVALRYGLPRFDPSGVARLVEEAARRVGGGTGGMARFRLMTNLLELHDLAVEAGSAARTRGATHTTGTDVEMAVERRRMQYGAGARRAREEVLSDRILVPTAGATAGQINGLGVHLADPVEGSYGVPSRISVVVGPGREERLVDVEREADAADPTHIMGALTMAGYLAERYGREHPISAVVRIRFEQSYAVGGPSASAAELFALLSALAEAPIYSSLAVTGAIGQYGEIQVIGGVNQKIEGFWEICRKRRAAGEQPQCPNGYGVLIPQANVKDLMLRREVAESIAYEGWFHVWPIRTVDDGLPLLTNLAADEIHRRVERQLRRFYRLAMRGRAG